jgi:uncharacterized NAD(P)/FAD-binding protein YdhS
MSQDPEIAVEEPAGPDELGAEKHGMLIAGTDALAVRYALRAVQAGHLGPITFVGQISPPRSPSVYVSLDLSPADIPLGTGAHYLLRWFRRTVRWAEGQGLDATAVVNGLKPHAKLVWKNLPAAEKRRFRTHVGRHWQRALEVLTAAETASLSQLFERGQAHFLRGRYLSVVPRGDGVLALVKTLPGGRLQHIEAAVAVDFRINQSVPASGSV